MQERFLLMIPGPIDFDPAVLRAMSAKTLSHMSVEFAEIFGRALENLRKVFLTEKGQPFVVAGSGTLAMDMAVANLVEPGERVLVLSGGFFGDRMADIARRYQAEVVVVKAPIGEVPSLEEAEKHLKQGGFKAITATHVDTSTGVAVDVKAVGELAQKYGALSIIDGVCATAGMEFRQDEWGIDVYLTASQKAIGVPPGLALLVVSQRAMEAYRKRRSPVLNYYGDFGLWLPVMEAYEARKVAYFATPAVNLIYALDVSLQQILAEGMENRFARHRLLAKAFQAGIDAIGLKQVPLREEIRAWTLTCAYYPDGIGPELLKAIKAEGVVVAAGLHPEIKDKYFRVGHMGTLTPGDVLTTLGAIERALASLGYRFEKGAGVKAAQEILCLTP